MQAIADELYESWLNGNRTFVLDSLDDEEGCRAALLGALVTTQMNTQERTVFFRMLKDRINTT